MSSSMSSYSLPLVLLTVLTVLSLSTSVHAFGAGDIPDFSFLNDRAFRHGDIENVIKDLVKVAGTSGGMYGFAQSIMNSSGGKKFSSEDVKRIYFGNWLRDYSQCMDIGGLSKLTADTLVLVVSVLGFLEFGFATEEYEVTPERLGVYLPVEHIDNPKGYAAVEGDARQFHPLLRPPVDPRELEVDHRTGMKNYMATEDGGWDTSTLYIRRSLRTAIELGRRSGLEDGPETNEAFRLMGQALHTLEDLLAHSNWCEVGLRLLGFQDVFCHVGDQVLVDTPRGPAPPLVTGTFTIRDLVHSLLGEAADHLSQTSVVGLTHRLEEASANDTGESLGGLRGVLEKVLGGGSGDAKTNEAAEIEQQSKAYHFDPENVASPEVVKQLHDILIWRDGVMRDIQAKISMIPGLESLMENMSNGINTYIYTLLAPYLTPVLTQVTGVLHDRSQEVIEHEDQYEVFNDPYASDPTHSVMSKDHFGLILNEPAGKIARHVVTFAVNAITAAWADTELDPDSIITTILEAFHHPYYSTGESAVQNAMMHELQDWINGMDPDAQQQTIAGLTKDAVRNGLNKRLSEEEEQEVMRQQEATEHAPQPTDFSSLEGALGGILGGGVAGFAAGALLGGGGGDGEYEEREPDYGGADEDAGAAWRGGGGDEYQQEGQQEEQQFEIPEEVGDAIGSVVEDLW